MARKGHLFVEYEFATMMDANLLIILDLDNTLIYGSYAPSEMAELLFRYNDYVKVYERPLARKLVELCGRTGDVIVYTSALRDYARGICSRLNIKPKELLSRKHCRLYKGRYYKTIREEWLDADRIIIIDDSPDIWKMVDNDKITMLVPDEFRGQADDVGLKMVIERLLYLQ